MILPDESTLEAREPELVFEPHQEDPADRLVGRFNLVAPPPQRTT